MFAQQRVRNGEGVVRGLQVDLREGGAVGFKQCFERRAVAMPDEYCRDGRVVGSREWNEQVASRRARATGVGSEIVNDREGGACAGGEVDLRLKGISAALDQSGFIGSDLP